MTFFPPQAALLAQAPAEAAPQAPSLWKGWCPGEGILGFRVNSNVFRV